MIKQVKDCEICKSEMVYGGINTIRRFCSKACRAKRMEPIRKLKRKLKKVLTENSSGL